MTEALGKKPPSFEQLKRNHGAENCGDAQCELKHHYRKALLEAAEELHYMFLNWPEMREENQPERLIYLEKKLRISAGEEK